MSPSLSRGGVQRIGRNGQSFLLKFGALGAKRLVLGRRSRIAVALLESFARLKLFLTQVFLNQ
jgi:hypothetical protein